MRDFGRTQILLDKRQRSELDEIAEKKGLSFSELVRTLLAAQLRQRKYEEMRQAAENLAGDYQAGSGLIDFSQN